MEETLNFYATIFGTPVIENYRLIEPIYKQIEPFKKRQAGRLSGGMKQKLALSCALIHKPRILILDEPTTGVDAVSRTEFWEMLAGLREEGITIIVSTPYMDEALRCDRIGLIQSGSLLSIDTPEKVRRSYSRKLYAVRHHDKYKLLLSLRSMTAAAVKTDAAGINDSVVSTEHSSPASASMAGNAEPFGDSVHITLTEGTAPEEVLRALERNGLTGATINEIVPGIEDVFLELMKKER